MNQVLTRKWMPMVALGMAVVLTFLSLLSLQFFQADAASGSKPYPASTNLMLFQWGECEDNQLRMDIMDGDDGYDPTDEDSDEEYGYLLECVNYLPQVFCKAKVLGDGSELDTDKDGIKNRDEYWMGLNPCERYSVGGTRSDADFDYDGDGKKNGKDDSPICNMKGLYVSDCV